MTPLPIKERTSKRARDTLNRAAMLFREAVKAGPDLGPDHEVSQMIRVMNEYFDGIGVNWKAWENE
jgi:hypothetical protein